MLLCFNHRWFNSHCLRSAVASCRRTFASGKSQIRNPIGIASDSDVLEKREGDLVSEIVLDIRSDRKDLEAKLTKLSPSFSVRTITEIFAVLNNQRVLGLRFYDWIRSNNPKIHRNARICSLIVDNFGRLDDSENMLMLKELSSLNICLSYEAFGYLPALSSTESSLTESTQRAVDMLNTVGGSCRNSGVYALVEMFCKLNLFDMAKYVVRITEEKEAYFALTIREKCRRGVIQDALGLIAEMEAAQISPCTTVYNYILASLCKKNRTAKASALLDSMKEAGVQPDAATFEILIMLACKLGKFSDVHQLLDQMVSRGIEPRPETHMCIIRAMCCRGDYEAAHRHVVRSCAAYRTASNMMFCSLARLLLKSGDVVKAAEVVVEMMDGEGLKPDVYIYKKMVKQLKEIQRQDLATTLQSLY